jgi:hypothetical protein
MKHICCFLLCLPALFSDAQTVYFNGFDALTPLSCPFDTTQKINYPKGWRIYQTQNGLWDGPVDASRCISAELLNSNGFKQVRIRLDQMNPAQPLFLRAEADELALKSAVLKPNHVFNVRSFLDTLPWLSGATCAQALCSGAFVGISIPDSNGVAGGATRWHVGIAKKPSPGVFPGIASCFPTERFADQKLREIVLKFTFPAGFSTSGKFLRLNAIIVESSNNETGLISEILAKPADLSNGIYTVNVKNAASKANFFIKNFLLLYNASTYPSPQRPAFVEARPEPNTAVAQTINLSVDKFQTLNFQPFANIRGGLAASSDTLRHRFNLINNGGDFCLSFVDLIFSGGEYQHAGGHLGFQNPDACMQFRDKSALRVKTGATLHYGDAGAGMLLLCAGSTLALERDATLSIDGQLVLSECNDALPPQQIYMDLPPGARLVFTDKASIHNDFSKNRQMRLNVRMLGGTLDDSALSPEDRDLIRRVYPEPSAVFADNVRVGPNPFGEILTLSYRATKTEKLRLYWSSTDGRIALEETQIAEKGDNQWRISMPAQMGLYWLRVQGETGQTTLKMARTE